MENALSPSPQLQSSSALEIDSVAALGHFGDIGVMLSLGSLLVQPMMKMVKMQERKALIVGLHYRRAAAKTECNT